MKTEQEQIEQIEKVLKDSVADYKHLKKKGVCYCYAETLIDHGYGDVSEYKAENERLTKILNSMTFSKKETDIFGKPALLMLAGVKVEEAIKRVTEYNGLKAENEQLKAKNKVLGDGVVKAFTNGFNTGREQVEKDIRRAKINAMIELKEKIVEHMGEREYMGVKYKQGVFSESEIDEFIKEVEEQ